jgi:dihydrofolate reductase
MSVRINIIAVFEKYNKGLTKNGKLPWSIAEDQKYFDEKVKGHVVIMDQETFNRIGREPLTTAKNIVITNQKDLVENGFLFVGSLDEAIKVGKNEESRGEVFVVGGSEVYKKALSYADKLYLTIIDGSYSGMDTYFPDYSKFTKEISNESRNSGGYKYSFVVLEK